MPISPMTKSASIYQELKRKILEGILDPGTHLIIKQISSEYGISDIPVREALKELNAEGLVETIPHVGSKVAAFSQKNINICRVGAEHVPWQGAEYAKAKHRFAIL